MIVVMQCAARKHSPAGAGFMRTQDGRRVCFVADPAQKLDGDVIYARPDDPSDTGPTWREVLRRYNEEGDANPLGLLPAYALYREGVYQRLAKDVGLERFYILSAGWGLIGASFLTPNYDITFSGQAKQKAPWKVRRKGDRYDDLCHLPSDTTEPVVFFGGKDYVQLFCKLTKDIRARRTVFYWAGTTASNPPEAPGCTLQGFPADRSRNWHYKCASEFLEGGLAVQP